jgi:predicted CxxxxCH...CXXCH cytochrome family protein
MKTHKFLLLALLLIMTGAPKKFIAQTPTWADNIATIMYGNCTSCHHAGGLAPNPLMSYTEAYNFRFQIKQYVTDGYMPPWPPDAGYKHLAFERILSDGDKAKISDWVLGGAPEGNPANAPQPPVYSNNNSLQQ